MDLSEHDLGASGPAMSTADDPRLHRFYSTDLAPCPYLAGRQERRLVALVEGEAGNDRLDLLTEAGFRRSQGYLYKPVCPGCRACVPVRIVVGRVSRPAAAFAACSRATATSAGARCRPSAPTSSSRCSTAICASAIRTAAWSAWTAQAYREMVEVAPATTRLVEFRDRRGQAGRRSA